TTNVKDNNTSNDAETQSEDTTPSNQLVDNDNSNDVETDDSTTVAKDNDAANDETEAKSDEVASQKEDT
ncbi:hypothetical protein, partial [Staphylococcus nepalensis]